MAAAFSGAGLFYASLDDHAQRFPAALMPGVTEMSEITLEEKIRARAFELWQQDGELEGCADEYWHMARTLVEKETAARATAQAGDPEVTATV